MAQKKIERLDTWPEWFTGKTINEPIFCREFLDFWSGTGWPTPRIPSSPQKEGSPTRTACGKPFISSWNLSSSPG